MPIALIVVAFVLIAVGGAAISYHVKKKRREALALFARQHGLGYSPEDIQDCLALPFRLLTLGDGRGTENLVWGTWQGVPIREFDYWYYDESTDSEGHRTRSYHRYSCAVVEVEAACSHLTIARENLLTRLADHLAMHDIEFESDEFNEAFNVKGEDRRFANDLLDARMIRWLLTVDGAFEFEVGGRWILCYSARRAPVELVPLLGTATGFREHVPRVVFDLYGPPTSG